MSWPPVIVPPAGRAKPRGKPVRRPSKPRFVPRFSPRWPPSARTLVALCPYSAPSFDAKFLLAPPAMRLDFVPLYPSVWLDFLSTLRSGQTCPNRSVLRRGNEKEPNRLQCRQRSGATPPSQSTDPDANHDRCTGIAICRRRAAATPGRLCRWLFPERRRPPPDRMASSPHLP